MTYRRPPGASRADFAAARQFEEQVGEWLGDFKVAQLDATDKLDWWVPGAYIDVKEKRQRLSPRWHLLPGVAEQDLMVVDELSIRRAHLYAPHAYFLLRDVPGGDRLFLVRADEMFCAERVRRNRNGKGKWIVSLAGFRQLAKGEDLLPTILADQVSMSWKASACINLDPSLEIQV